MLCHGVEGGSRRTVGDPVATKDPVSRDAHEALDKISGALSHNWLGHPFHEDVHPWPEIEADLRRVIRDLHPRCEYLEETKLLPSLIEQLYSGVPGQPIDGRQAVPRLRLGLKPTDEPRPAPGNPLLREMAALYPGWVGTPRRSTVIVSVRPSRGEAPSSHRPLLRLWSRAEDFGPARCPEVACTTVRSLAEFLPSARELGRTDLG